MADIVSPDQPTPQPSGQPASPVAPIVPGQYSSGTVPTASIGMVNAGAGDSTTDYGASLKRDLYNRLGLVPYEAKPETHGLLRPDYQDPTGGWQKGTPPVADQWQGVPDQGFGQVGGMEGPRISGPGDLDYWYKNYSPGMKGPALNRSVHEAFFGTSLIGAGFNWKEMHDAIGDVSDPNYDPFGDRQIRDAGLANQMSLFYGSQSRAQTNWLINHVKARQRETEWAAHGSVADEIGSFMGGVLGDPSSLLPGNLGVKSLAIANRAGRIAASGNELRIVSAGRAVYGGLGDAVRTSAIQAGVMIAEKALTNQLDPTIPGDISTDLVLPSVIAGSMGLLQGVAGRYAGRRLADQVHDADFLKPTPAAPPGPIRSLFGEPVTDTVAERVNAFKEQVRGLKEKVETIPELLRDKAKEAGKEVAGQEIMGEPPPSNGGNFPAGALATSYGPMRTREHVENANTTGFTAPISPDSATRISNVDLQPGIYEPGKQEALVITPDGKIHRIERIGPSPEEKAQAMEEGRPGNHAEFFAGRPDLVMSTVALTRFEDQIAASMPRMGRTPKQEAALQALQSRWTRAGKADQAFLGLDPAQIAEIKPVSPITANNHWLDERGKPVVSTEGEAPVTGEGAHQPGSVGAQLSPESLAYQESVLRAQGRLVPTGIGLENMPLNPIMRAFQGASVAAMRFAADVASTGGLITRANVEGIANLAPVETLFQVKWNKRLVDTLRFQQDQWSAYRHKVAGAADFRPEDVNIEGRPDWKRTGEQVGEALKDRISPGERGLSFEQFRIRVAEAQNKGDRDATSDAASPYVNAAAAKFRTDIYDHAKKRAIETGVFDEVYQASLDQAHSDLNAIEKEIKDMGVRSHVEKWTPDQRRGAEEALMARQEDAEFKYNQQKKQLDNLRDNGPLLNGTAESYRPRLWDTGRLIDNEQDFFDKVVPWFQSSAGGALDLTEAVRVTKQIHETLAHQNPIFESGDMKALFQSVAGPTSAHARSFTIPDELVKDFLVNDSEALARYHVQQMGKAIEFKERFGSLDANEQIAEIEQDYRRQIIEANKGATEATPEAIKLAAQMKTAITDAQALRDKFYGTYGASSDPHRWDSRTIRMAKQFNNLTMLGMSGISALGDLMRPVMTEGIDAVYGYGIRSLMSESRALIMKMNKQELELEGNGMELQMNVRAMAAADTGDVFGSRSKFEHGLNQANAWNFVANGLNGVNQIDKEWARLSVGGRVNNILLDAAAEDLGGGALRISELDRGRFAAAGIGEDEARRIGLQIKIHGKDFGNITMPNTTAWTDDYARDVYRSAMNQFVNRTVPTPGIGDRSNWISTEWGSLIGQYKSFGMGSLIRGGISGLQEGGNRFWYGAAAAVGFAILLNEIRSQLFYGKSTFDKPAPAVIVDGIDRSGILGWFTDVNRAVETLSGHRVGLKPMLGAESPTTPSFPQVAGTIGGPTAGQAARAVSVANDFLGGHPTATTMRNWRALTPLGNHPLLDPVFDATMGSGTYQRGPKPGRTQQPQAGG